MTAALETLRGTSARIEAIRKQVAQLLARQQGARRPPPVVILGETGTGKGLLAPVLTVRVADPGLEIWTGVGMAREYFAVGDYRRGIERARAALDWLGSTPATTQLRNLSPPVGCRTWLALCLASIGQFTQSVTWAGPVNDALAHTTRALSLADELEMRPLVAHCRRDLGDLYRRTGQARAAEEHRTAAATMYQEMNMRSWLERLESGR
jgi:hypothetical protein